MSLYPSRACSVLVIDDSEALRLTLKELLEKTPGVGSVFTAQEGLAAFKVLREQSIDLILCDLIMPGIDGLKFLRLKSSDRAYADIPVLVLTTQDRVEDKVRALNAGANDYLTKPFDPIELTARVRAQLKVKRLQDELREKNDSLERLIRTDPLTGAANRRYFFEVLTAEFHRTERYRRPLSFYMMDIDHFKKVNDTYGHQPGDQALVVIAKTLEKTLRVNDFIARYGGEEFAAILPETNKDSAIVAAERCRKKIEATPVEFDHHKFTVTVSVGVASLPTQNIGDIDTLIKSADDALYQAKQSGRNRVMVASS
jgi:diguanylate cyclase (GGDEF)-like protein